MKKDIIFRLQNIVTEKFINDEISIGMFLNLTEKVNSFNKNDLKKIITEIAPMRPIMGAVKRSEPYAPIAMSSSLQIIERKDGEGLANFLYRKFRKLKSTGRNAEAMGVWKQLQDLLASN